MNYGARLSSEKSMTDISKILADHAEEERVKPIVQPNDAIMFQRDVEPPKSEPLEDHVDEIEKLDAADENEVKIDLNKTPKFIGDYQIDELGNPILFTEDNSMILDSNDSDFISSSVSEKTETKRQDRRETNTQNENNKQNKNYNNIHRKVINNNNNSPPQKIQPKTSPNQNVIKNQGKKENSPTNIKIHTQKEKNSFSGLYGTLGYLFLFISIILAVVLYNQEADDPSLKDNEIEKEIIFLLNDCVSPIKFVYASQYPTEFIEYVQNDGSKYIKYESQNRTFVVKKPRKTLFCKAIDFGDKHPDLGGVFILWFLLFIFYFWYRVSRSRAETIVPLVMEILNEKKMCYIDEAKQQVKDKGYTVFGAWWQVKSIIKNKKNVKTMKVVDAKPFWALV